MQRKQLLAIFLVLIIAATVFMFVKNTVTSGDADFMISVGGEVKLYDPNGNLVSKQKLIMLALMNGSQEIDSMVTSAWWRCGGRDIEWSSLKVNVEVRLTVIYQNRFLITDIDFLVDNEVLANVTYGEKGGEHEITLESLDEIIAPYIDNFVNNSLVTFKVAFKISAKATDTYGYVRNAKPIKLSAVVTLKWVEPYLGIEGDLVTDSEAQTYEAGYSDGYNDGYDEGYDDGYRGAPYDDTPPSVSGSDEYVQGYEAGYKDGYDEGYWDGYYAAQQPGTDQIASIMVLSATSSKAGSGVSMWLVAIVVVAFIVFMSLRRRKEIL